jgi:hypothetical protein
MKPVALFLLRRAMTRDFRGSWFGVEKPRRCVTPRKNAASVLLRGTLPSKA